MVPRRLAREACARVKAGGRGIWVSLRLSRCGRALAQEGMFRMVQGTQVERAWMGEVGRLHAGPRHRVDSRDESRISS